MIFTPYYLQRPLYERPISELVFKTHVMDGYNADKAKEKLLKRIRRDKRDLRKGIMLKAFRYTVVGLFFLGLGYTYHKTVPKKINVEEIGSDKNPITLKMSDGTIKTIIEKGSISILATEGYQIGFQDGNRLVYQKSPTANAIAYNMLKVPYGKKFGLILSDGSKVNLNSGSTLKYPVHFEIGSTREVYLEGEGYFAVAKDEVHPFIVKTKALNIRVLGTQFNLSAYTDDENISTVLVEGSVGFFDKDTQFDVSGYPRLLPGHIASWQKHHGNIKIEETDTELYTGWLDGKIIFDHMPFRQIRKKLERHYNVSISNRYKELEEIQFTASFDTETIGQVLEAFSKNYSMKYSINDNKISIDTP